MFFKIKHSTTLFQPIECLKNMCLISLQRICKVYVRMCMIHPDSIKAMFFQRESEQLLTLAWDDTYPTASQQSVPYSLDHRTNISNYKFPFGWE